MNLNTQLFRKDTKWPVGFGYGPVFNGGPSNRVTSAIKSILIHTTNDPKGNTDYRNEAAFLRDAAAVSSHYVVSSHDSTVVQILPDTWIAWHAGDCDDSDYENTRSIGIEIAWTVGKGNLPAIAIQNTTDLVVSLLRKYPNITKIDTHRAQAIPKGRKVDPSGWSDAAFYAWRDATLKLARQSPSQSPQAPQDGLPSPLPYIGVATQPITAATFNAVLTDHMSPLAPFADYIYQQCVMHNVSADVWLAQCAKESSFMTTGLSLKLCNPLNIRQRGDYPGQSGFADFLGAPWLGAAWSILHCKLMYGQRGKFTLEDIVPIFAPAGDGDNNPQQYIQQVRATVADIRKREA